MFGRETLTSKENTLASVSYVALCLHSEEPDFYHCEKKTIPSSSKWWKVGNTLMG